MVGQVSILVRSCNNISSPKKKVGVGPLSSIKTHCMFRLGRLDEWDVTGTSEFTFSFSEESKRSSVESSPRVVGYVLPSTVCGESLQSSVVSGRGPEPFSSVSVDPRDR